MSTQETKLENDDHVEGVDFSAKAKTGEQTAMPETMPETMPEDIVAETKIETDADVIKGLEAEIAELKDKLLRARAEMENIRRRADKDKIDASAYAVTSFARDMLNVSDNLRRALDSAPGDIADDMKLLIEGVEMTERELLKNFNTHGITLIKPNEGDKFDHKLHQAMFEIPTDDSPNGTIMQVVAPGYVIKDRLLRPAMVGVVKGSGPAKIDTEA